MKGLKNIRLFVFMIYLCLFLPHLLSGQEMLFPNPDLTISMDFQDANLKDILKIFSIQSGMNFIASEAVQDRKVTLYLDKVPIEEAMNKIFKANNLSYELERDSNIFLVKDWGKPQIETLTKVFYLKHAIVSASSLKEEMSYQLNPALSTTTAGTSGATSGGYGTGGTSGTGGGTGGGSGKWAIEEDVGITKTIEKILSEYGSVIEDFRTNSLIVTDIPSRMPIIAQTIAALDVPAPQVMLEVEMLDVSKNVVDKMGIKFGQTPFTMVFTGASISTLFPLAGFLGNKSAAKTFTPGSVNFNSSPYTILLDFLKTQTDTKFLARPRILTLNNETAEIKIATQESIGVTTTTEATSGTTSAQPERSETGVSLRVTPQINIDTQEITMFIYPRVAEAVQGSSITSNGNTFRYRDPEVRSTKSVVRIKDGETVVIGGLIRNEFTQVTTKVPILGDLPLIGFLFRHKGGDNDKNKERELLVFITPHIVKETVELAQAKETTLPEREQNTISGIDRQAVINSSLNNFEQKKR